MYDKHVNKSKMEESLNFWIAVSPSCMWLFYSILMIHLYSYNNHFFCHYQYVLHVLKFPPFYQIQNVAPSGSIIMHHKQFNWSISEERRLYHILSRDSTHNPRCSTWGRHYSRGGSLTVA